ncbi:hypothetical protein BROUX41_004925 [Berkeleyomyces rouxiae]|uniref:uncharacterized protein n=1 Tax=Berkeleyomyces rouxiae TaxID=2035830 RepID=UPI003B78F264
MSSSITTGIKSAISGTFDGLHVLRAASQDAYSWVRFGAIKTVSSVAVADIAEADKIFVLVPDRLDQHESLRGLASIARATVPSGHSALVTQVRCTNFTTLSAQDRGILGLDDNEEFDKLDFVAIGDVTLELVQGLQRIIGANPRAEIALLSQGTGATAVSGLSCGPAPIQFTEPGHEMAAPLIDQQVFRRHVFADVRFSDRSHDASAPWNTGSASGSGRMVRPSLAICMANVDRTLSICNSGDAFCDSGRTLDVTRGYFGDSTITSAVSGFVQDRLFGPRLATDNTSTPVPAAFLEDRPHVDDNRFLGLNGSAGSKVRRSGNLAGNLGDETSRESAHHRPTVTAMATRPSYPRTTWKNPEFFTVSKGPSGAVEAKSEETSLPTSLAFPGYFTNSSTPLSDSIAMTVMSPGPSGDIRGTLVPLASAVPVPLNPTSVLLLASFSTSPGTGSVPARTLSP